MDVNPEERPTMPMEGFRFIPRMIDSWCTDRPRPLIAGSHFPDDMAFEDLEKRLKKAARLRRTYVYVWPMGNGMDYWVHFGKVHPDWESP